jgi:hypothetical protein
MHLFGEFPFNTTLGGSRSDIANSARLIDVFFKDSPEQAVRIGCGGAIASILSTDPTVRMLAECEGSSAANDGTGIEGSQADCQAGS